MAPCPLADAAVWCPVCRLINPMSALRCDCGYNFSAFRAEARPQPPPRGRDGGALPTASHKFSGASGAGPPHRRAPLSSSCPT